MFTRNYDNLLMALMGWSNSTNPTQTTWENSTNLGYKTYTGSYVANYQSNIAVNGQRRLLTITGATNTPSSSAVAGYVVMVLGTGTATEDYNDYTMTADTNLTMNSYTTTSTIDNDGNLVITNSKIATNNTTNDITITEIGIVSYVGTNSSSNYANVLLYRKKLDTPVVVEANGGVQNFELKFTIPRANMPSA